MSIETVSAVSGTEQSGGMAEAMARVSEIRAQLASLNAGPGFQLPAAVTQASASTSSADTTGAADSGLADTSLTLPTTIPASGAQGATGTSGTATSLGGGTGAAMASYALTFLGTPYVWGGTTPKGFDCSGLVQYVAAHFGITVPRVAADQARAGVSVDKSKARIGDLLFFDNSSSRSGIDHVAIYLGGGRMVQAPHTGDVVKISPVQWDNVVAVRRVTSDAPAAAADTNAGGTWQALLPAQGKQWADEIADAAAQAGIDPRLLAAVTRAESNFDPDAGSGAGAIGLTQLMPATARGLGVDPRNPRQNLLGGARYLKIQLARYDGNLAEALSAYNAGPARVHHGQGVPNIAETQAYVKTVTRYYNELGGRA